MFERVNLYKDGATLNLADLDNAAKAEIVPEAKEDEPVVAAEAVVEAEVVEAEPVVEAEAVVEAEVVDSSSDGDDLMAKLSELDGDSADDSPKEEAKSSGDDDLMAKLSELDDTENKPKKKEKKSDDDEDQSGMDDILGKLDEL